MKREHHKRRATFGQLPAAEIRRRQRANRELAKKAHGEKLQQFLKDGGDANEVRPELIPDEQDRLRLERAIRSGAAKAAKQPKGNARNRKVDALIPLVAELCVVERVLALDQLQRAGLRPAQLVEMAHTSPAEMHAKLYELVAGVIGGGDKPKIEVARG